MASVLLTAVCRSISTAFCSFTPTHKMAKCQGMMRLRTIELLSRRPIHVSRHQKPSAPRLDGPRMSSTSSRHRHSNDSHGLRTSLPWLPGFSVCSHRGIRNIGHIRGESSSTTTSPSVHLEIRRPISFSVQHLAQKGELVTIHFINRDGEKMTVKARTGQNLLDIVVDNDLDIDGYGACEGTLSCSTCHLIFSEGLFKILPKPSDEELDMLDLAYGQTDMSRLGCQVILTKDMDGMTVVVPDGVADARDA